MSAASYKISGLEVIFIGHWGGGLFRTFSDARKSTPLPGAGIQCSLIRLGYATLFKQYNTLIPRPLAGGRHSMPTHPTRLRHTVNAVPRTLNRHQPKHLFTHPIKEKPRSLERGVSVSNHLPRVVQPKPGPHRRQTYQYVQKHIARRQEKLPVVVQRKRIQRKRGKRGKPAQQPHDYK